MKASFIASIKKFRAKIIALIVLTLFVGAIYNASDRNVVIEESKYDFSKFKKGDVIALCDSSNNVFDWIIVHDNGPLEMEGEFVLERRLSASISVPLLSHEMLNQYIRQNKLSVKLYEDSTILVKDVLRIKLGKN